MFLRRSTATTANGYSVVTDEVEAVKLGEPPRASAHK